MSSTSDSAGEKRCRSSRICTYKPATNSIKIFLVAHGHPYRVHLQTVILCRTGLRRAFRALDFHDNQGGDAAAPFAAVRAHKRGDASLRKCAHPLTEWASSRFRAAHIKCHSRQCPHIHRRRPHVPAAAHLFLGYVLISLIFW